MGWLGWSYDTVMDTPMPEIERAYRGRSDMFRSVLGGKKPSSPGKPNKTNVAKRIRGVFRNMMGGQDGNDQ